MHKRFISVVVTSLLLCSCASMPLFKSKSTKTPASEEEVARQVVGGEATAESNRAALQPAIQVPVPDVKPANRVMFERALVLMQAEDWLVAESLLAEVSQDQPELAGPWVNLAIVRRAQGHLAGAEAALAQALQANPHNCDALNQLGVIAREAGRFTDAEKHYQNCIKANPSYLEAQLNLGILYELYMGRYGEALAAYQDYQLAQVEPDPKVNGWLIDLERRVAAVAQR
ncbi:MAG: tetratricopeptide (TPR) repeat protein [Candidatus Azotimanducaceae bacterium]|jgi:tetratricopeptide (TPR) repeat protein